MNQNMIQTYCEMINSLTEQQTVYNKDSADWLALEKKLVELECKLFNNLVLLELNETEYLFKQIAILPLLALHLYKYFDNKNFETEISVLNDQAKLLINLIQRQLYLNIIISGK